MNSSASTSNTSSIAVGPRYKPLVAAINRLIMDEGGEGVRHRMVNGKSQYWVTRKDGSAVAGERIKDLAQALGVKPQEKPMEFSDGISPNKAATISGYSSTTIHRAVNDGEIVVMKTSPRKWLLSRASVLAWAEKQKKLGGFHQPRLRVRNAGRPPDYTTITLSKPTLVRLTAYLRKLADTPLEMTIYQFGEKVISMALDKLKA